MNDDTIRGGEDGAGAESLLSEQDVRVSAEGALTRGEDPLSQFPVLRSFIAGECRSLERALLAGGAGPGPARHAASHLYVVAAISAGAIVRMMCRELLPPAAE